MQDTKLLQETFEKAGIRVYKAWRAGGDICITPEATRPKYVVVDGTGKVHLQDPVLSHPSVPYLTYLGKTTWNRNWPEQVRDCYLNPVPAPVPEPALSPVVLEAIEHWKEEYPKHVAFIEKLFVENTELVDTYVHVPEIEEEWVPAISRTGPVEDLEVNRNGDVRWKNGKKVSWDLTRPSQFSGRKRHHRISVMDVLMCTFIGPPPTFKHLATEIDSNAGLVGVTRTWPLSNLQWSLKRPVRSPRMSEEQVAWIFAEFAKGTSQRDMSEHLHVATTSISGVLRGFTHAEKDDMRRDVLKQRKKNKIPDDTISLYMEEKFK